jgi:hypothetical protein
MAQFDLVKHRPARYLPVILLSVMVAAAISRLVGDELVPALIQLSVGR